MYGNVIAEDYLNTDTEDETEADGKEKTELPKNSLNANLAHALSSMRELLEFSLYYNNSKQFDAILI
jgi:hypothetical protein